MMRKFDGGDGGDGSEEPRYENQSEETLMTGTRISRDDRLRE